MTLAERKAGMNSLYTAWITHELTRKEMESITGGLDVRTLFRIQGEGAKKDILCNTFGTHEYMFTGRCREKQTDSGSDRLRQRRCRRCGYTDWVFEEAQEE